jgi:RHS repeat-associated protein
VVLEYHDQWLDDPTDDVRTTNRRLIGPGVDNVVAVDNQQHNLTAGTNDTPDVIWTFTDRQGTVRDLYQTSPQVRGLISYDAFGRPHDTTGLAAKTNVFYAGRELDYETGLYNNRARWYDPAAGRFISEDPIYAHMNPYRYSGNSPANFTDPTGFVSFWEDPLEWGYGRGGAIWDVGADDTWRGTLYRDYMAEGVRATLGDQYLAQAGGWELLFGTSAAVTAGVFTGTGVTSLGAWMGSSLTGLAAFGAGLGTSVVAGAAAGGAEYLTMTLAAAGYNTYYGYGADTGPTLGGFGGSMAGGAIGGGVFHLGGTALNALGRGLAAGARYVGRQALGTLDDVGARLFAPRFAFAEGLAVGAWQATMSAARAGGRMSFAAQPFGAAAMGGVLGNHVYFASANSPSSRGFGPARFKANNPQYNTGRYEVHHSREWNVLKRYQGTYTPEELNLEKYMRATVKGQLFRGKSLHRSVIRKSWDRFRDLFQERYQSGAIHVDQMRRLIETHAQFIDRMYLGIQ